MIRYIPFLKAKRGEFNAMSDLALNVKAAICPFFDFPRKKENYDANSFAVKAGNIERGLKKHWGDEAEFYFDDLDVAPKLSVFGKEKYEYIMGLLQELRVIPVVGLNRSSHNASVAKLKRDGEIESGTIALRVLRDDFEEFDVVRDQIVSELGDVFGEFDEIDLILDCRVCGGLDVTSTAQQIAVFARKFSRAFTVRRTIVTGSSIPGSLSDLVKSNSAQTVPRRELAILAATRSLADGTILEGDYTTVSPFFSDADFDPRLFQKVTAPRLIYSFNNSHYIARGQSLESGGPAQYVGITNTLCEQPFYRGRGYSTGEKYFDDKRKRIGRNATNGTIVTPSIVAHITYMVLG